MKKNIRSLNRIILLLVTIGCLSPALSLHADEDPKNEVGIDIWRGYKACRQKVVTGYHLEHFGFLGGEFVRTVKEYEYQPCCRVTHDKMEGCSAGVKCS